MTIELTPEQEQQLATIASDAQRSTQDIVGYLVEDYLARMAESRAMLARADEQVAEGKVVSHEEVWKRLEARFRD